MWARRGGSWIDDQYKVRSTSRSWSIPEISSGSIGFRCAGYSE
ncbi:MAG: hypothetical protein DRJ03_29955 [Chloroflexi bacterium]|nr:MAG: hypothetical protein DRJ03_29955 [Chloroflexota bacterium]